MRILSLVLVLGLAACGPTITGDVTDMAGNPLAGSIVNLQTTRYQVAADEAGHFKISAEMGEFDLAIAQTGFVTEEVKVNITESSETNIGTVKMIKVPETDGLKLRVGSDLVEMHPGRAYRSMWGKEYYPEGKDTCVDRDFSKANEVPAGAAMLFDKNAPEWRMWKLDEDGCAYRIVKDIDTGRWSDLWGEQVQVQKRELSVDQAVIDVELEPGEYFISEWFNGKFVQLKGDKYSGATRGEKYADAEEGLEWNVYNGWWIVAK